MNESPILFTKEGDNFLNEETEKIKKKLYILLINDKVLFKNNDLSKELIEELKNILYNTEKSNSKIIKLNLVHSKKYLFNFSLKVLRNTLENNGLNKNGNKTILTNRLYIYITNKSQLKENDLKRNRGRPKK